MLICTVAIHEMIRWQCASTALPSLKYLHISLYHHASTLNQDSYNPSHHYIPAKVSSVSNQFPSFLLTNHNEKQLCNISKMEKSLVNYDQTICDWECFTEKLNPLSLTAHCDNARTKKFNDICYSRLWLQGKQCSCTTSQSEHIVDNSRMLELLGFSQRLFINSESIQSQDIPPKTQKLHFGQSILSGAVKTDKQPADDPGEKIRLLTEKLRIEPHVARLDSKRHLCFARQSGLISIASLILATEFYHAPKFLNRNGPYHDFSIYAKSVELYVTLKRFKFSLSGLQKYKLMASSFRRFHLLYLSRADIEILNLHTNEEQGTIEMRWRITGWTPLGLIMTCFTPSPVDQSYFDFSSTLYVNKSGQVWRHDISKMESLSDRITVGDRIQEIGQRATGLATTMARQISVSSLLQWRTKFFCNSKNI